MQNEIQTQTSADKSPDWITHVFYTVFTAYFWGFGLTAGAMAALWVLGQYAGLVI